MTAANPVGAATPVRRTQVERRAASRTRLLEAALLCLAERGYAGTTFPEVLSRAGLSNGALWRHFRSKAELLAAAALYSQEKLGQWAVPAATDMSAGGRLDLAVDNFWRFAHQPEFQALIELLRASRSDSDIAEQLRLTDEVAATLFFETFARLIGPELASHPQFRRNGRVLGLVLYGDALTFGLRLPADERRVLADLKQVVRLLFG